uniref:Uncharacterized protein n=1 Tax=Sphaerodactylus townsendi TaxID=933632 RepID=A0ACB8EEB1_9SAUR
MPLWKEMRDLNKVNKWLALYIIKTFAAPLQLTVNNMRYRCMLCVWNVQEDLILVCMLAYKNLSHWKERLEHRYFTLVGEPPFKSGPLKVGSLTWACCCTQLYGPSLTPPKWLEK